MTPQELKAKRLAAGLSRAEAARLSQTPLRTWEGWEADGKGNRRVPGIAVAWLELYVEVKGKHSHAGEDKQ